MSLENHLASVAKAEKEGDLNAAEGILRNCLISHPDDERPLLKLGWLLHNQRRRDDADRLFAQVFDGNFELKDAPAHGSAFDQRCHKIFSAGVDKATLEKVEAMCRAEIARHGERSWASLFLGAVAYANGDEKGSFAHFEACVRLGDSLLGNSYGSYTFKDNAFVAGLANYELKRSKLCTAEALKNLKHHKRAEDRVVYLLSCDGFYFSSFGAKMAASIDKFGAGSICHVHVINPTDASRQTAQGIAASHPELRLNITESETSFSPKISKLNRKAFYTCGRFLVAPDLLRFYDLPVLISEFDGEVVYSPALYADALSAVDIGVSLYDKMNFFPWNTVWAGTVFMNRTEIGRLYASLVAKFCGHFLDEGDHSGQLWHVDQNALYCVYRYVVGQHTTATVRDVKKTMPTFVKHHGGIY